MNTARTLRSAACSTSPSRARRTACSSAAPCAAPGAASSASCRPRHTCAISRRSLCFTIQRLPAKSAVEGCSIVCFEGPRRRAHQWLFLHSGGANLKKIPCLPALIEGAERDRAVRRFHHHFQAEARKPTIELIAPLSSHLDCRAPACPDLEGIKTGRRPGRKPWTGRFERVP